MRVHQKTNAVIVLTDFLKQSPESVQQEAPVIGVVAPEYPLLLMQRIAFFLQHRLARPIRFLDLSTASLGQTYAQLAMSFLGQEYVYCLGDTTLMRAPEREKLYTHLSSYVGPHNVLFFAGQQAISDVSCVTVQAHVQARDFQQIMELLAPEDQARCAQHMAAIFTRTGACTVEQAVHLTDYVAVLGSQRSAFLTQWLPRLIKSEASLFQLSGALFAGDARLFGQQWQALAQDYEFPFWLVYFSEQFFRAYFFITLKRQGAHEQAKKMSYRLPFSFIQRDYKRYEPHIFLRAHEELRALDAHLKTGGDPLTLERVFSLFV